MVPLDAIDFLGQTLILNMSSLYEILEGMTLIELVSNTPDQISFFLKNYLQDLDKQINKIYQKTLG